MEPVPVKPGWTTTEFWMTTFASIIGLLVAVGVIGQDDVQNVNDALANAVKSVGGFVAAAGILWKYIQSRATVKAAVNTAVTSENNLKLATLGGNASRVMSLLLMILLPCIGAAADYTFLKDRAGKHYLVNNADPSQPNRAVTVNVVDLGSTVTPPVIPPVTPPVVPPIGDIATVAKGALATVGAYEARDNDRRTLAFTLNFLASSVAKATNVTGARAIVRQGADMAVGANKSQWDNWWRQVDAKLDTMSLTSATYSTALSDISSALVADLPASDEKLPELKGEKTFGLNIQQIFELLLKLWPIIKMLLEQLAINMPMQHFAAHVPIAIGLAA